MSLATLILILAPPVILVLCLKDAPLFKGLAGERRVSRLLRRRLDRGGRNGRPGPQDPDAGGDCGDHHRSGGVGEDRGGWM